jgi:hypothetical protein
MRAFDGNRNRQQPHNSHDTLRPPAAHAGETRPEHARADNDEATRAHASRFDLSGIPARSSAHRSDILKRAPQQANAEHAPPYPVEPDQLRPRVGNGVSLPSSLAAELGAQVGHDLRGVRVHADARGDYIARSLGAQALAFGQDIAIRSDRYRPETSQGRALLRHEAAHVAERAGQSPKVQLQIDVEDVGSEMEGLTFVLRSAQGSLKAGDRVVVVRWNGTDPIAKVRFGASLQLDVPKLALEPESPSATGVRRYSAGLKDQQTAVENRSTRVEKRKSEAKALRDQESKYKTRHKVWETELKRAEDEVKNQETLLAGNQKSLNRVLIQQVMYNRFDPLIAKWVDFYNKQLKPKTPCDPNIVKSMMFKESRIGTSATELSTAPATSWADINTPLHAHTNVLMNIVSSGEQQMIMLKEMAPDLITKYHLDVFEKAQKPTKWDDTVIWANQGFRDAVKEMFQRRDASRHNALGSRDVDLQQDYEFWIRTGVRWLFFKYFFMGQKGWQDAAHAYNGLTKKGEAYAKEVMSRVGKNTTLDVSGK